MSRAIIGETICPACGQGANIDVLNHPLCRIVRCGECKIAQTLPRSFITTASYDANPNLAAGYESTEADGFIYSNQMLDHLKRFAPSGKLLDVGCSIGTLVHAAQSRGYDAQGIDLDSNAIPYGISKGRRIALSSVADWPVFDYDALVLQHTLEHVPEPMEFLRQCTSMLRVGGTLIASVPCYRGWQPMLFGHRWYGWQLNQHYFHYSKAGLRSLFQKAGLTVVCAFQNSMDHSIRPKNIHSIKRWVFSILSWLIASIGGAAGHGDQLIVIGQRAKQ